METDFRPAYWKLEPLRELVNPRLQRLTPRAFGILTRLRFRAMAAEPLPGILDFDEAVLAEFGGATSEEWAEDRVAVLTQFHLHPPTKTLHHRPTQQAFKEQLAAIEEARKQRRAAANHRWEKAKKMRPHARASARIDDATGANPYAKYENAIVEITRDNAENLHQIIISCDRMHTHANACGRNARHAKVSTESTNADAPPADGVGGSETDSFLRSIADDIASKLPHNARGTHAA